MLLIRQRPERYLYDPRFVFEQPRPILSLAVWEPCANAEPELEYRLALQLREDGSLERCDAECLGDHDDPQSACRFGSDRDEVFVEHDPMGSKLWFRAAERDAVLVWQGRGIAVAPTFARGPGGVWVAFHHNVREDTAAADVAKWIALRFVDAHGRVFEPDANMVDRNRDRDGVEQSFEFPELVVGPDGAIALFGRGSHNFWRQDLNARGFSERVPLSDGAWASRGRRVTAARWNDQLVIARREREGIKLDLLDLPSGGAPALRRAAAARPRMDNTPTVCTLPNDDPALADGLHTYFGDIQQHSAHSDGIGTADEAYLRARYHYEDDFVALTDHESFLGKRTSPREWQYLQRVAERYNDPGAFATLIAYEWTGKRFPGPGHKCVYLPKPGIPIVSRDDVPRGRDLVQQVREQQGFSSPHHIGWTGCDEEGHDPEGQPLWEICSCHGCYEHANHPLGSRGDLVHQMVDVMLKKGHRFGFTASSDSHGLLWHHGESRKRDPYRTGLTGVQAARCTREEIMRALVARRCYATSGAKILLDVRVAGQPMGSELEESGEFPVEVRALGTSRLEQIDLIGPEGAVVTEPCGHRSATLTAHFAGPWLYVRVIQQDGEMAWSSPVFWPQLD